MKGVIMASFMMAMTIVQEFKKDHPDITHQVDKSLEIFSQHNIKVKSLFATLGRYDYLVLFDAVEQTEAFKVAAEINSKGVLRTETWPLIPYEDFSQLVG